ncbi:MAG: molybdopterin converting factor subunit 1 [Bacteroidota bacterium]
MEINLKLFGITREIVGKSEENITLNQKITVNTFLQDLKNQYPALGELSSILVAVNNEYAESDMILADNDEVALIPPVSGG